MVSLEREMTSIKCEMTSLKLEMASIKFEMTSLEREMTSYLLVFNFCPDNRQLCLYNFHYKVND